MSSIFGGTRYIRRFPFTRLSRHRLESCYAIQQSLERGGLETILPSAEQDSLEVGATRTGLPDGEQTFWPPVYKTYATDRLLTRKVLG